jgi:hypothetical protein
MLPGLVGSGFNYKLHNLEVWVVQGDIKITITK